MRVPTETHEHPPILAALRERLGKRAAAVRSDAATRAAYASDASIYRVPPAAVVEPHDADDVAAVLDAARATATPVTARGGGTSVAGNAIGSGIVVDFATRMNRIIGIDPEARTATVQPGVVLDDLRAAAAPHGLTFGPDPSTHSRCTIGGMIGNNACGSHSVAWGTTADNVVALTHLLPDGRRLTASRGGSGDPGLDARLAQWRAPHLGVLRTELDRFGRQVSGYGLHHLLPENGFDVAKALVGSESTCGLVTEATVRLVEVPAARALLVLGFPDVFAAAAAAPDLARSGAMTVEGMASDLLDALRSRPGRAGAGADLPAGQGWLYCEFGGATAAEAYDAAARVAAGLRDAATAVIVADPARARALWRIRESGAGIVTRMADGGEAWPGWEDSAVPPERLAGYLKDLYALLGEHGLRGVPFGHFGEGCLHLRCDFDLGSERGLAAYRSFITDAAALVAAHGGSVSGEHGDGRARSELLAAMYSPAMLRAFSEFKALFDPDGLLNPGVLVAPAPLDEAVRPGPGHAALEITPVHAFGADGGSFAGEVRRCVGVGACRSTDTGSMCPSFKATRDEVHSTRGRARVLSEMLRGETVTDGWRSEEVRDALDLCLSCKACASECPVNVDMATYKAEFLYHHYEGRVRPMAHYSMGWLPVWSRLATAARPVARAVNAALALPKVAALVQKAGGIEPRRSMIRFAEKPLRASARLRDRKRARKRARPAPATGPTVVVWPDTFTNFHSPEVGRDAVAVLEALGYRVEFPDGAVCCGLTWHSTGQLDAAKRMLRRSLDAMAAQLAAGCPVVGLEPSCTVMLRDEARALLPDDPRAQRLAEQTVTLAELVAAHEGEWPFGTVDAAAVAQVHCHQEAKGSYDADLAVLRRLGVDPDVVGAGCCGLAGNFGFEPGHYEVSQACAERELFPKVRAAGEEDLVLADGFSCRTQVAQGTERTGRHLAQVLRSALRR
ncbi:FAD/FMN-containing dehydrogenase [Murinocardiopsis flavida]|uniref:FAD/FMN-containing dehydrogenase n=1 Tax=Murinocardiopsis flavida TaxID=645275 RepID=A0A2P8DL75_9ACTN|nr:FAD-binding and (Fe-S)-binding domain-containing protein [Murinocardiopsis flavida]PSK97982.1 FAD/FMN-containing dehydrogenase [Murinocardiopsis flavida]